LADFCDVFCEEGYFDYNMSLKILNAAKEHGLKTKLHADEFVDSKGARLAKNVRAKSADHLMAISDEGIR
jgi:imidazolonepropionase